MSLLISTYRRFLLPVLPGMAHFLSKTSRDAF
jgi:hypothetical protein